LFQVFAEPQARSLSPSWNLSDTKVYAAQIDDELRELTAFAAIDPPRDPAY